MLASTSLGGRVRNLANLSKPHIDIDIRARSDSTSSYIDTFSTLDRLEGTVSITCPSNTPFDNVEISLVGSTRTFIDRLSPSAAISARSEAFQMFLKMDQPMDEADYPADHILQAGRTYTFPFTFVIPTALPGSCKHNTTSPKLKDLHLKLPPSLGDPDVSGTGASILDDCAPEMVKITYGIRVRLQRKREGQDKDMIVSDRTRKIRIVPALEEQPPIPTEDNDEYLLRREKSVRKGLLKNKTGRVVMEASQPKSLHLSSANGASHNDDAAPTTMATVQLRFDPNVESAEPPKLGRMVSKLRVGTFFASTPRMSFPSTRSQIHDTNQGLYVDVLPLSSRCMSATEWLKHEPHTPLAAANLRRDSGMSLRGQSTCPEPSKAHKPELPFYTAQLLIPISLPRSKALVPTFHSCLVSRVYILELSLSLLPTVTVGLKVPLQISSEGTASADDEDMDHEGETIEPELSGIDDDFFTPRRVSAPVYAARPTHSRAAPPPDYSFFAPRSGGVLPFEGGPAASSAQLMSMVR